MALLGKSQEMLMTGEELSRRPDLGPCELVDGKIVSMTPTGDFHAEIESELDFRLRLWTRETRRGRVMVGEAGLYIRRNPDTVRGADLLFISHERYAHRGGAAFLDVAPELVVEVLSPEDRWNAVQEKLADYFSIGVDRVWVV